jgi:phenylpyruvate tautomerase PptA (4-oxalocrotonate tautomerase family)
MPLVRISVPERGDSAYRRAISDAVHRALVDAIGIPPADRFHVITAHAPQDLIFDPSYLEVARSPGFVVVDITFRRGRPPEKKRALYRAVAANVHAATGTRVEDVMIVLHENDPVDWSFGAGIAQYAPTD